MGSVKNRRREVLRHRADAMRSGATDAEGHLWAVLQARRLGGWRWRRQAPFGPFILDFLCREASLVVEIDGAQHAEQAAYDARRTAYLANAGLRVVRFWNGDVLTNRSGGAPRSCARAVGNAPRA